MVAHQLNHVKSGDEQASVKEGPVPLAAMVIGRKS